MKLTFALAGAAFLLAGSGCSVIHVDPGPTQTANEEIDAGKAEAVRAEIRMGGGDLRLQGGGTKLMTGSFRYSERLGRPIVRYDLSGSHGRLTVRIPETGLLPWRNGQRMGLADGF